MTTTTSRTDVVDEDADENLLEDVVELVIGLFEELVVAVFVEVEDVLVVEVILEVMSFSTVLVVVLQVGLIVFLVHDEEPVIRYVET